MAAGKANVYEMVTARIIAELEKGNIPWEKPWTGTQTGAFNRISKKPYSLINQMLLIHTGEYATFKQWADLGGHVRKGEKSEIVVFWKILEKEETDKDTGEKEIRKIPMLRYYNDRAGTDVTGCSRTSTGRMISEPLQFDILIIEQHYRRNTEQQENKCFSGTGSGSRYRDHSIEGRVRKGLFISV